MPLKPHVIDLVSDFQKSEGPQRRGPKFEAAVLALEAEMLAEAITLRDLLDCFGPPDLFAGNVLYIYAFDHEQPGRNKDEWYFHFANGQLVKSGYNKKGANDVSQLTDGSKFIDPDIVRHLNFSGT